MHTANALAEAGIAFTGSGIISHGDLGIVIAIMGFYDQTIKQRHDFICAVARRWIRLARGVHQNFKHILRSVYGGLQIEHTDLGFPGKVCDMIL